MYKITFLPTAEESFRKLDPSTQRRIAQKIDWLSENADKIIHRPLDGSTSGGEHLSQYFEHF
jgi:mRNA-degrading endonuclease RelE of RelBE toxin-antitoxin system